MVVDLPAPLGPTKPVTLPGMTVKVMPSRASGRPNRLRTPVTSMLASLTWSTVLLRRGWRSNELYDMAGVSTVSVADTVLTPESCHGWTHCTSPRPRTGA